MAGGIKIYTNLAMMECSPKRVVGDVGSASFDAQSLVVGLDGGVVFLPC